MHKENQFRKNYNIKKYNHIFFTNGSIKVTYGHRKKHQELNPCQLQILFDWKNTYILIISTKISLCICGRSEYKGHEKNTLKTKHHFYASTMIYQRKP